MQIPPWLTTLLVKLHLRKQSDTAAPTPGTEAAFGHHEEKKKIPAWQKKLQGISPWAVITVLMIISLVFFVGQYCYYTFYEIGHLETVQKMREDELFAKKQELKKLQGNEGYLRYKATEKLIELDKSVNWRESVIYLIGLYDIMKALGSNEGTLTFSDFQISSDRIIVRGVVPTLSEIYKDKGLLDRLVNFEFIEHLKIPYFDGKNGAYNFVLDAHIKQYDRIKGTP